MKLVIKKSGVDYSSVSDIANIGNMAEGSLLLAFDDGTIIAPNGTFLKGGAAATETTGDKCFIYAMLDGEVRISHPIKVGAAALLKPLPDHDAVKKVMTLTKTFAASDEEGEHTGLVIWDYSKNEMDPTRRRNYSIYTDDSTVIEDYQAIATKVAEDELVYSCAYAAGVFTVTFVEGANGGISGLGAVEDGVIATTAALKYGDTLSADEMAAFALTCSPFDGNRDGSIDGDIKTFQKDYGIEDKKYILWGIETDKSVYATGKTDLNRYGATLYLAHVDGEGPADGEGWMDIFNAALTGVPGDSVAEGVDADN